VKSFSLAIIESYIVRYGDGAVNTVEENSVSSS